MGDGFVLDFAVLGAADVVLRVSFGVVRDAADVDGAKLLIGLEVVVVLLELGLSRVGKFGMGNFVVV